MKRKSFCKCSSSNENSCEFYLFMRSHGWHKETESKKQSRRSKKEHFHCVYSINITKHFRDAWNVRTKAFVIISSTDRIVFAHKVHDPSMNVIKSKRAIYMHADATSVIGLIKKNHNDNNIKTTTELHNLNEFGLERTRWKVLTLNKCRQKEDDEIVIFVWRSMLAIFCLISHGGKIIFQHKNWCTGESECHSMDCVPS